jgi:hypothetical protein
MISKVIKKILANQKKGVSFSGMPLTLEEATAVDGGLPVFFRQTELLIDSLEGDRNWITPVGELKDDPNSLFGQSVEFTEDQKKSKVFISPFLHFLSESINMASRLSPGDNIDLADVINTQASTFSEVFNDIHRQTVSITQEPEISSPGPR